MLGHGADAQGRSLELQAPATWPAVVARSDAHGRACPRSGPCSPLTVQARFWRSDRVRRGAHAPNCPRRACRARSAPPAEPR